jgi:hypothetical protein
MNPGNLGWALIVVGSLIGVAGAILLWAGQQIVTNPERLVPPFPAAQSVPAPVLNPQQHKLLERIHAIQQEFGQKYIVLGMHGRVHFDDQDLNKQQRIDLTVEILRGDPVPEDNQMADREFEGLIDSMPTEYLRRLDREDPSKHLRFGQNVVVSISEDGIRYLRDK